MSDPIVKWVGGKRQLLPIITQMIPRTFETYYEPFFGGGALFFELHPTSAVINDFNPQLIQMYRSVQTDPDSVKRRLDEFQNTYNSLSSDGSKCEYYYGLREEYNRRICNDESDEVTAALLIFLNKAGYNGLYRVNKSGRYNVPPAHRKRLSLYAEPNFSDSAKALSNASILCGDFSDAVKDAKKGDFVFIDSPYYDTFDNYQSGGFSEEDHERLASVFADLSHRNVKCLLTNSNTDFIKNLYKDYNIRTVPVKRMVNSDAAHRTGEEVIITNYPDVNQPATFAADWRRAVYAGTAELFFF